MLVGLGLAINEWHSMHPEREFTTTSISIPTELLDQVRIKAARSYRTLSQYISYLIDQDLRRDCQPDPAHLEHRETNEKAVFHA